MCARISRLKCFPLTNVRRASASDLEACVALACVAAQDRAASEWCEALGRDIDDPERHLVVATTGNGIIGYGRARLFEPQLDAPADTAPRGYYLTGVFVRPERRRNGVGHAITQVRLGWIGERADEAWFFANARNAASIQLHNEFAFEEVTRAFFFPGLAFEGGEGILYRVRLPRQQP